MAIFNSYFDITRGYLIQNDPKMSQFVSTLSPGVKVTQSRWHKPYSGGEPRFVSPYMGMGQYL